MYTPCRAGDVTQAQFVCFQKQIKMTNHNFAFCFFYVVDGSCALSGALVVRLVMYD
jgi:hypothetical protein